MNKPPENIFPKGPLGCSRSGISVKGVEEAINVPEKCPQCGAGDPHNFAVGSMSSSWWKYECGTEVTDSGEIRQSDGCKLRQVIGEYNALQRENERLQKSLSESNAYGEDWRKKAEEAYTFEQSLRLRLAERDKTIDKLAAENAGLREALADCVAKLEEYADADEIEGFQAGGLMRYPHDFIAEEVAYGRYVLGMDGKPGPGGEEAE